MNVRRQAPVIMPNVVKRVQQQPERQLPPQKKPQKQPEGQGQGQVVTVPVAPVLIHESNESGEICDNTKINTIIYNIGDENVEECIPVPVLEEPVIETLSKPVKILVDVEEVIKTKVEDNKKKNKKKNVRK
jgi:hypothetical protein